jgi:replicative DNA helicase
MSKGHDLNDEKRAGKNVSPGTLEAEAVPMADPDAPAPPEPLRRLGDLLDEAVRRAEARRSGAEKPVPVPWPELGDQLGGGLWPGLHLFVGGTGTGKSTLALQIALEAARKGTPTAYVGLELGELDIALRVLGEQAGVSWSKLYTGRASETDVTKAGAAKAALASLPFYVELGKPNGWPASDLGALAERMRLAHPEPTPGGLPMLLVLDFLQIVGDEAREDGRAMGLELRERIGRAAYFARDVSRRLNVAVLCVSSTARDNYGALGGEALEKAGLGIDKGRRFAVRPDSLVGMGKESGELEYSADSVTVAVRGPKLQAAEGHERCVVLVTAKGRATGAGWCALRFEYGQRFKPWQGSGEEVIRELAAEKDKAKETTNGMTAKKEYPRD